MWSAWKCVMQITSIGLSLRPDSASATCVPSPQSMSMLKDYPCLSFEQGEQSSLYLAEEILGENEYPRTIKATDRATMLNLMVGLNGYTLCSGIICEELNGSDYVAIPFKEDRSHKNAIMTIGYITKKHNIMSDIGETFIQEVKNYLK